MKKLFLLYICMLSCAALLLSPGCVEKKYSFDIRALSGELASSGIFVGAEEIDPPIIAKYYGIDTEAVASVIYTAVGVSAEEFGVFDCKTPDAAEKLVSLLQRHLEAQKEAFRDYAPAELTKLENAFLKRYGGYVIMCVTGGEGFREIIEAHVNGK